MAAICVFKLKHFLRKSKGNEVVFEFVIQCYIAHIRLICVILWPKANEFIQKHTNSVTWTVYSIDIKLQWSITIGLREEEKKTHTHSHLYACINYNLYAWECKAAELKLNFKYKMPTNRPFLRSYTIIM